MGLREEILADGPWNYLPMDERSGTNFADASGAGRNGTGTGSVITRHVYPAGILSTFFSGGTSFVDMPDVNFLHAGFTLEIGMYETNAGTDEPLFSFGIGAASSVRLTVQVSTFRRLLLGAAGVTGQYSSNTFVMNTPYHVACTSDGTTLAFYVDGVNVGGTTLSAAISNVNRTDAWIGKDMNGFYNNNVNLSHAAIFTSALSPQRIAAHAAAWHALRFLPPQARVQRAPVFQQFPFHMKGL